VPEAEKVDMDVSLKVNSSEICFSGTWDGHEGHRSAKTFISPAESEKESNEVINDLLHDSTKPHLNEKDKEEGS